MSEGSYIELALRDLSIEIEKLQEDRDRWRNIADELAKRLRGVEYFPSYEYQRYRQALNDE
jgi:hypothetical protein